MPDLRESSLALPFVGSPLHAHFNPNQHPRGRIGRFVDILGKLERSEHGSTVTLPHGITLRRDARGIAVHGGHHSEVELGTTHAAAAEALFRHDMHPDEKPKLGTQGHARVLDELESARRAAAGSDLGDVEHLGKRQNMARLSRREAQDSYLKTLSPDLFKPGGGRVYSTPDGRARIDSVLDKIHVRAKDKTEMAAQDDHLNQILRGRANEPTAAQQNVLDYIASRPAGFVSVPPGVTNNKSTLAALVKDGRLEQEGDAFRIPSHPVTAAGLKGLSDDQVRHLADNIMDPKHSEADRKAIAYEANRRAGRRRSEGEFYVEGRKTEPVAGQTALFDKSVLPSPGVKPTGRKNQATSWWLQNTPEGKRMLGRMGVAGYRNGPLEFKDLDHGDHFVYDSARPKMTGVHRKVGHHAATDEAGTQTSRHPFDRVRKVPAPRGRKNEEVGFEGVGDFNGDPFERHAAHQAAKGSAMSSYPGGTHPHAGSPSQIAAYDLGHADGTAGKPRKHRSLRYPDSSVAKAYVGGHQAGTSARLALTAGPNDLYLRGRKNEAVGGTPAWMKKPMTHEHIMAFLNGGPEGTQVTQQQYVAAKKDGLAGMLAAGAIVRPEHAAALEKAGYWPKARKK